MKASVVIITYNQARFIEQAVESVLSQRTNFDFEVVIGEDCSTDNTRAIVRRYAEQHPGRVRALLHDANLGSRRNFVAAYQASRGQYLAVLDGDDYWTSPEKLQRQVDLLDSHPDYSICFHSAMMVWEDSSQAPMPHYPPGRKQTYTLEELLTHDFVTTSTMVVRNRLITEFPAWYWKAPFGDWPFLALNAMHGPIGYLDECWSVYRQHGSGVYCALPLEKRIERHIELNRLFLEAFDAKYHPALRQVLSYRLMRLALLHHQAGRTAQARDRARQYIQESSPHPLGRLRNRAKLAAYMRCPALVRLISALRFKGRAGAKPPER